MQNLIKDLNVYYPGNAKAESPARPESKHATGRSGGIAIDAGKVARYLAIITVLLLAVSTGALIADYLTDYKSVIVHKLVKLFYVELEVNVPAFFSSMLLLFVAQISAVITKLKRTESGGYWTHWMVLSLGFLFMSFDELASVHERLIEPMRALLGGEHLGVLHFAWVVPAIVLVMGLAALFFRFLKDLPRRTAYRFCAAACVYLGGAIVLEMAGARYADALGEDSLIYMVFTTVEEMFEMAGTVIFIWALLDYIRDTYGRELLFRGPEPAG